MGRQEGQEVRLGSGLNMSWGGGAMTSWRGGPMTSWTGIQGYRNYPGDVVEGPMTS